MLHNIDKLLDSGLFEVCKYFTDVAQRNVSFNQFNETGDVT